MSRNSILINLYRLLCVAILLLCACTGFGQSKQPIQTSDKGPAYKDGVYTGEWKVWPEMKVEVTVKKGKLDNLKILEDFGTPEFSIKAIEKVQPAIIKKGSTDVEAVTGATLSSNSLKKAVDTALKKALHIQTQVIPADSLKDKQMQGGRKAKYDHENKQT